MTLEPWSDDDYQHVFERVRDHLWKYVQAGAAIEEIENAVLNLTALEPRELDYLNIVHFLLSNEVKAFIERISRILRRLSHSTRQDVVIHRGFVKGRIDWNLTIKERATQGCDRTIFVCRPPSRIYNLPENQLLKYLLTYIQRLIDETKNLPQIKDKRIQIDKLQTSDRSEKWIERITWLRYHVNRALKHAHLRAVELPMQVTSQMRKRARFARNKEYELVDTSYELHRAIILKRDAKKLRELVETRVLKPLELDTLYELFVLFEVMNALGVPTELNLIRPRANVIGTYLVGEDTVKVYYQKVSGLFESSKYKQIFDDYTLNVSSRRPDITLYFPNEDRFLIIEVKRTKNRDYIVDSVYKVLGYLADFETYFPNAQKPKGVLVVWTIERVRHSEQDITILGHKNIQSFIQKMVNS